MMGELGMLIGLGLAAAAATLAGGALALRFSDRIHLILGFSAGAVIGVALFDLLPEAFALGTATHGPALLGGCVGAGFFAYLLLDRVMGAAAGAPRRRSSGSPRGGQPDRSQLHRRIGDRLGLPGVERVGNRPRRRRARA